MDGSSSPFSFLYFRLYEQKYFLPFISQRILLSFYLLHWVFSIAFARKRKQTMIIRKKASFCNYMSMFVVLFRLWCRNSMMMKYENKDYQWEAEKEGLKIAWASLLFFGSNASPLISRTWSNFILFFSCFRFYSTFINFFKKVSNL